MRDPLRKGYDVVVVGAGPGGLLAALELGRRAHGLSVALVDWKDPWQEPVACAEAVHKKRLEQLVPKVEDQWVRGSVDGVDFLSPNGTRVRCVQPGSGLLLDRALMHRHLAETAREAGVHCNFRTRARGLSRFREGRRMLFCEGEASGDIAARVVIDASGPGAGLGRGERIVQGDFDLEPALFALVRGLDYPVNYIQMFFGKRYAPGGYAWLFPRDSRTANVGLVIGNDFRREAPPRAALRAFLQSTYPGAQVELFKGGGIACGYSPDPFAVENLFKVGDAANMVHPISRAGILEAMEGGRLAARAAMAIFDMKSEEEKKPVYRDYKNRWDQAYGNHHRQLHRAKAGFNRISDKTFDRAAARLARIPPEKLTIGRIVWSTLLASPAVLWHMRGLVRR